MNSIPAHSEPVAAPRLLDKVRSKIRLKHYSLRTEQTYVDWIKRFIRHFGKRRPRDLGAADVEAFPTQLAVVGRVAASTRNQARSALLFLYRDVSGAQLPWLDKVRQAKTPRRLAVLLTRDEVQAVRGAGAAGPFGRQDHHDLHPRPQSRWARSGQSHRPDGLLDSRLISPRSTSP